VGSGYIDPSFVFTPNQQSPNTIARVLNNIQMSTRPQIEQVEAQKNTQSQRADELEKKLGEKDKLLENIAMQKTMIEKIGMRGRQRQLLDALYKIKDTIAS